MPTYERLPAFVRDWKRLEPREQRALLSAVRRFVEDVRRGRGFRPGLRVKGVQGAEGIFEMTWAPDGRATFSYGDELRPGEPHIVWRQIGTHDILKAP
jgi:hypothetical protein